MIKWTDMALLSGAVLGLSACMPTYTVAPDKPKARFSLAAENESRSTTMRNIWARAFKNLACEEPTRAGNKVLTDGDLATEAVQILAGESFVFTTTYMDARFAQNRKCSVTGSFVPQADRTYKGVLLVNQDVTACKL